jgi:hypothetical protein
MSHSTPFTPPSLGRTVSAYLAVQRRPVRLERLLLRVQSQHGPQQRQARRLWGSLRLRLRPQAQAQHGGQRAAAGVEAQPWREPGELQQRHQRPHAGNLLRL